MKNKINLIRKCVFLAGMLFLTGLSASAQPGGGGCDPNNNECDDGMGGCVPCTDIPLDGGVGWLLAAGAVYGFKKFKESRKKETTA